MIGELEQLWDRRDDTAFLEAVARSLQPMRTGPEIAAYLCPPLNLEAIIKLHLRAQSLWRTPPANARGLLRRIDYLLEHIQVDNSPCTFFRRHHPVIQPDHRGPAPGGWTTDLSVY